MAFFRVLLVALVTLFCASQVMAQGANQGPVASEPGSLHEMIETALINPIRTESPRSTLQTLYQLRNQLESSLDAYWKQQNRLNAAKVTYEIGQMRALIDLSQVPSASRRETGEQTALYLLDILGRVKTIDAAALPGPDEIDDQPTIGFRLPGTPLRIVEITEGDRAGEYLFSADTVHSAPQFFAGLRSLPLRSSLPITSWEDTNRQLTGPWIPSTAVAKLPNFMKRAILDTSVWKIVFADLHNDRNSLASVCVRVSGQHRRTLLQSHSILPCCGVLYRRHRCLLDHKQSLL